MPETKSDPIQNTEDLIISAFDAFIRLYKGADKYAIDSFVVMEIARRYHKDDERIKTFHPDIPALDGHKKAGYLTYWVSKLKPIVITDFSLYDATPKTNPAGPHYVNELFAVVLGFGQINYRAKLHKNNAVGLSIVTFDFINTLLHTLKYRVTSGDNLSMMYYLIDELVPLKSAMGSNKTTQ